MSKIKPAQHLFTLLLTFSLALLLFSVGCSSGTADAQSEQRVETFEIIADTFVLTSSDLPDIEIAGTTTQYQFTSSGRVVFNDSTNTLRSFSMDTGEIVIERPESGLVTIIRSI